MRVIDFLGSGNLFARAIRRFAFSMAVGWLLYGLGAMTHPNMVYELPARVNPQQQMCDLLIEKASIHHAQIVGGTCEGISK